VKATTVKTDDQETATIEENDEDDDEDIDEFTVFDYDDAESSELERR